MGENNGQLSRNDMVYLLSLPSVFWCWDVLQRLDHEQTEMMGECWGVMVERRVDGSMPSPSITSSQENMEIPAVRVNHNNARMPDPTKENLEALALKAWIDYAGGMQPIVEHEMPQWDDLSDELKQVWLAVAKGQHVVMSLIGGASIEKIEDAE
jgi:hypothetical protein